MNQFRCSITVLIITTTALIGGFLLFFQQDIMVDEGSHLGQIQVFLAGEWHLRPELTTTPLIHLLFAWIANLVGESSLPFFRLLITLIGALSVFVFWRIEQNSGKGMTEISTLQYVLSPILFPFLFLLYTDVPSLFFILWSFHTLQSKRYTTSAITAFVSMLIRQNAIVWFTLIFFWFLFRTGSISALRQGQGILEMVRQSIHENRPAWIVFGVGFISFMIFVALNRGIAIGDSAAHPFPSLHFGNIFFSLLVLCLIFLPLILVYAYRALSCFRTAIQAVLTISLAAVLYLNYFTVDHEYNLHDPASSFWFIRNMILEWMEQSTLHRWLAFIPIALSLLSLHGVRLIHPCYGLLYPATVLFFMFSWLIEQRYYLVPFTLFLIVRKPLSKKVEWATVIWEGLLTVFVITAIRSGGYFL